MYQVHDKRWKILIYLDEIRRKMNVNFEKKKWKIVRSKLKQSKISWVFKYI